MTPQSEHRCLACGQLAGTTRRRHATVGKPFAECLCGAYVVRPPFDEWALMSPMTKLRLVGRGVAPCFAVGLLPAVAYGLFAIVTGRASSVPVLLIVAGAGLVLGFGTWGMWLARVVRASQRRMGDPIYQAKLLEFGMATIDEASPSGARPAGN